MFRKVVQPGATSAKYSMVSSGSVAGEVDEVGLDEEDDDAVACCGGFSSGILTGES